MATSPDDVPTAKTESPAATVQLIRGRPLLTDRNKTRFAVGGPLQLGNRKPLAYGELGDRDRLGPDRDRGQRAAVAERGREHRGRETCDATRGDPEARLHSLGKVVIEPQHHPEAGAAGVCIDGLKQIRGIVIGEHHQALRFLEPKRIKRGQSRDVGEDNRDPEPTRHLHALNRFVPLDSDARNSQRYEFLDNALTDTTKSEHHDVVVTRVGPLLKRTPQTHPDDRVCDGA